MFLITMREWYGYSRYHPQGHELRQKPGGEYEERDVVFITALPLGTAIERIAQYEQAFQAKYQEISKIVEFTLRGVQQIQQLTAEQIELTRVQVVEDLHQSPDQF